MSKPMNGRQYLAMQSLAFVEAYEKCQQQLEQAKTKASRAKIRKEMQRLSQHKLVLEAIACRRNKA